MVLGLTGKYCSGKNTVAEFFCSEGWYVIDVDQLGHKALGIKAVEITDAFGISILDEKGVIDRKKLGKRVFGNKKSLRILESCIHPEMVRLCKREIESCGRTNVVINAAILYKMGLNKLCDAIVWVKAPFVERLRRSLNRDSHTVFQSIRRMAAQRKLEAKYYSKDVDSYTILNTSSREDMKTEVLRVITALGEGK